MEKKKEAFQGYGIHSIRIKLTALIVGIMAIPLLIAIIVSYSFSKKEATKNMNQITAEQMKLVSHDFQTVILQNMQVLQTVANSVSARKVLKGELDKDSVQQWLARVDETIGDKNVLVIDDANGMQQVKSAGECIDVSEREYFKRVKADGVFYVSDQNISKTTGARICTMIYPIFDLDGTFLGAVQRNYNLSDFTQLVMDELQFENQDIFIGDNNGDIIAHTSMDLETGEVVNFASQAWYTDSRNSLNATGSYYSKFKGGNWCISYVRDEVTGWVTVVATDVNVMMKSANTMILIIVIVGIVMLVIASLLSVVVSRSFTKPLLDMKGVVDKLAAGEFAKVEDQALLDRPDEFGDIVRHINQLSDALVGVVRSLKSVMTSLGDSSRTLADSAEQIAETTDHVSEAVQEIAKGATEQADSIQKASENMGLLSDSIQEVANNAEGLATTASSMNEQSQSSAGAMSDLSKNMDAMRQAMDDIAEGINATNAAVQSVNQRVDGITSIASQTNLLALNASIEAARAGEAGKGFAVVAEEIGKLATESAATADEIRSEMDRLLDHSQKSIVKTKEVAEINANVHEVLESTVKKINNLIGGVGSTVDGVTTISGLSEESAASKSIIVDAISSLSAISEENAASTEETSASMQELDATVEVLSQSAADLNNLATQLEKDLEFFKM